MRLDHQVIGDLISPGSSVLDLGCGDGDLLQWLAAEKQVRGQGLEIDEQAIYRCVSKGLSVLHGDLDKGLAEYHDRSFDYVILNQSLQQIVHFDSTLMEALRVGRSVIVGFPNFAHYIARFQIGVRGRAPVTSSLPYMWYESPNVHFLSISDFIAYCKARELKILQRVFLNDKRRVVVFPNLFATIGIFMLAS
ncbi:methionine biosynthesis protein MetW [Candidatus Vecturithrix granuli]|uniref:Methionine biosynthesis protein MetW n=1 Tax=Vecturithrix granuli TaxID=1499967 RepID=A0A081BZH1_VECG1|nr:methionine biosynthesis protein MetW [Candidatus Vecturithrix granuli]